MIELNSIRSEAKEIFAAGVEAVDPYKAIKSLVLVKRNLLVLGTEDEGTVTFDLGKYDRIFVVGAGKATAPMAKAIEELLGEKIHSGLIVVKYGFTTNLMRTEIIEAAHPVPDHNGVRGSRMILDILQEAGPRDLIISLISGGGSALLCQPSGDITLEEKQSVTRMLLACGATIYEINATRKHISACKGGQMARAAYPATVINLMLSDVVGDMVDVIASGPFTPDPSTFIDALGIFEKYNLKDIPENIRRHIRAGVNEDIQETPKEGDPIFELVHNLIVGSNILALKAAEKKATALGYNSLILSSMIEGETRYAAMFHTAIAKEILKTGRPISPPACIISGGETTVTIHGNGLGGRNQEFCLAAAIEISGLPHRVVIFSAGTDGNDGPTDAAGAIADPLTVKRGKDAGLNAIDYLNNNDSYHFLKKTEDLLITGPTNTNVMDVRLILVR
ncbi:Glycerate 2-kinase [uncultured Desulfobacterium sp.]|uniref:Glycerate 2-kinase n=1 Tax=uncultured Desulfobacterium sp. TaxID=201089 RepID=A0A445N471_9BACT|nr:Glycerate 2-kinase [uncultured Desulfobacterium sp.]